MVDSLFSYVRVHKLCLKLVLFSLLLLVINQFIFCAKPNFASATELEGFSDELDDEEEEDHPPIFVHPPKKDELKIKSNHDESKSSKDVDPPTSHTSQQIKKEFEWDEEEFVGIPSSIPQPKPKESKPKLSKPDFLFPRINPSPPKKPIGPLDFVVEFFALTFLALYAINYYLGRKENERIAFAWVKKFAASEGSVIEKNFSLLGVGDGVKEPLLLKEGQNVFKFYASGRRFCEGMLITLNLKSRQDLLSLIYHLVFPKKDVLSAEVLMNEDAMDPFILAVVKKKLAKSFQRENADLKGLCSVFEFKNRRNFPFEQLTVMGDSREAATEIISDVVIDQVFADKALNLKDLFVSLHFTDQNSTGKHKKVLKFKFNLPSMDDLPSLSRLMSSIPFFIDSVGRFKLNSTAKAKADASRAKFLEEEIKENQNMKYEQLQKKKEEKRKQEEARRMEMESRMSPEAVAKKREKERLKEMKQSIPRAKVTKVH